MRPSITTRLMLVGIALVGLAISAGIGWSGWGQLQNTKTGPGSHHSIDWWSEEVVLGPITELGGTKVSQVTLGDNTVVALEVGDRRGGDKVKVWASRERADLIYNSVSQAGVTKVSTQALTPAPKGGWGRFWALLGWSALISAGGILAVLSIGVLVTLKGLRLDAQLWEHGVRSAFKDFYRNYNTGWGSRAVASFTLGGGIVTGAAFIAVGMYAATSVLTMTIGETGGVFATLGITLVGAAAVAFTTHQTGWIVVAVASRFVALSDWKRLPASTLGHYGSSWVRSRALRGQAEADTLEVLGDEFEGTVGELLEVARKL